MPAEDKTSNRSGWRVFVVILTLTILYIVVYEVLLKASEFLLLGRGSE